MRLHPRSPSTSSAPYSSRLARQVARRRRRRVGATAVATLALGVGVGIALIGGTSGDDAPEVAESSTQGLVEATTATLLDDETGSLRADQPAARGAERGDVDASLTALEPLAIPAETRTQSREGVVVSPRPEGPVDVLAAMIAEARADEERLSAYRHVTAAYGNGRHPMSILQELSWARGHFLRPDAAAQLERLNIAFYAEFGRNFNVVSTYRTFAEQSSMHAANPRQTAQPGTSNHGTGIAVDIFGGVETFTGTAHLWMRENAPSFGWILPSWAHPGGGNPQPWHWEFHGLPALP